MSALASFLVFLGIVGVAVALVVLAVRTVFRRGWDKKRIWTVGAVSVALFVVGMIIGLSSVSKEYDAKQQAAQDKSVIQEPAAPEPAQKSQQPTPLAKEEQKSSSVADNTTGKNFIPGLEAADIKLNLEKKWKLKFTGPRMGQELAQDNGEAIDPDTGIKLICNMFETSPLRIQWVDFVIDASSVAGSISVDKINAVAEGYFGYCATVPYDGADPAKAKQWVIDNVRKVTKPGNVLSTQIGPVKIEMFGTEYMRTLRVKPAK